MPRTTRPLEQYRKLREQQLQAEQRIKVLLERLAIEQEHLRILAERSAELVPTLVGAERDSAPSREASIPSGSLQEALLRLLRSAGKGMSAAQLWRLLARMGFETTSQGDVAAINALYALRKKCPGIARSADGLWSYHD